MARYSSFDNPTVTIRNTKLEVFKTPGSYTWTVPSGVTCATFELRGSGGGGGAKCCCDCYHQGGAGTAGDYASATIAVTPGSVYTICVPPGGGTSYIAGAEGSHSCCYGGAGAPAYVTGVGITSLCAGGGHAGNNDCYQYCLCQNCCGYKDKESCANLVSTSTSSCISKPINYCNEAVGNPAGGCHYSYAYIGPATDAQSWFYTGASGANVFGSSLLRANDWCCATWHACTNCSLAGSGGTGAFHYSCNCMQAGTGRHGQVTIRY